MGSYTSTLLWMKSMLLLHFKRILFKRNLGKLNQKKNQIMCKMMATTGDVYSEEEKIVMGESCWKGPHGKRNKARSVWALELGL